VINKQGFSFDLGLGVIPESYAQAAPELYQELVALRAAIRKLAAVLDQYTGASAETDTLDPEFNSLKLNWLDFKSADPIPQPGRLWYDATGILHFRLGGNQFTQHIGEQFFRYGKATSAITLPTLTLVYKTGTVGASGVVTFAPAIAGITNPDQILGIAIESIAVNGFGRILTAGSAKGLNTTGSAYGETWADNDDIWYNPVTGGLTKTKPSAPNIKLLIGTVIKAGAGSSGSFAIHFGSSSALGGTDSNVQLGTLNNNDFLRYDSALGYWKNVPGAVGVSGTFISADSPAKTITVTNGIITSIV
jgi:hypothetical protein